MKEEQILNETLSVLQNQGVREAYDFLVEELSLIGQISSQGYNFLYCLAAESGEKEEALNWMDEAINQHNLWYRPEVFLDEDLDAIRNTKRFLEYVETSQKLFEEAKRNTKIVSSWKKVEKNNLLLVLHGNQQNNEISKNYWNPLALEQTQIEYIQSKDIDSINLYRWNEDGTGPLQLKRMLDNIEVKAYNQLSLAGFSAGCNVILQSIMLDNMLVDQIILCSPWMPVIKKHKEEIVNQLKKNNIKVLLICGTEDEDCYADSLQLFEEADKEGVDIQKHFVAGLGHRYTLDVLDDIRMFLSK